MRLSIFYVCICLGLSVVGKVVEFDTDVCGVVSFLFDKKPITIGDTIKKIKNCVSSHDNDVESVCRLYFLLCFVYFIFL